MVIMINCKGTPYEMGFTHGKFAKQQIHNLIGLYSTFFKEWIGFDWPELQDLASAYDKTLREKVMYLYEEMQGIAEGAGVDVLDIILLNTRYEVGLAGAAAKKSKEPLEVVDGCTTFGFKVDGEQWIAQNYDWQTANLANLVYLNLEPADTNVPRMKVVAEAGVIGQVGFNDCGVSLLVNALHATNLDTSKVPCMVIRRAMLAQKSLEDALKVMEELGVSALSHILLADSHEQVSIETSPNDNSSYIRPEDGKLTHTNHCIAKPEGIDDVNFILDSPSRLERVRVLLDGIEKPSFKAFSTVLSDEDGFPNSINRYNDDSLPGTKGTLQTCYTIIINVTKKIAEITFGRPTGAIDRIVAGFGINEEGVKYANK